MKRIALPFIGVIAGVLAMAATRPTTVRRWTGIPTVRNESAGGTVLSAIRKSGGDDDETKADRDRQTAQRRSRHLSAGDPPRARLGCGALARSSTRAGDGLGTVGCRQLDDWNDDYVESVASAFRAWDAVELPIRFKVVADSADAEVHVTWIDRFDAPISGRTRWSRDDNWWIVNASIVLAVHHQQGEVLDKLAMKAMALHEVGHLLGLDHTTDPGMIMAPRVRVRDLTDKDKATIRLLYTVPAGPLR